MEHENTLSRVCFRIPVSIFDTTRRDCPPCCVLYIYLNLFNINRFFRTWPVKYMRESRTRDHGTGFRRVRVRAYKKCPTGYPCASLCLGYCTSGNPLILIDTGLKLTTPSWSKYWQPNRISPLLSLTQCFTMIYNSLNYTKLTMKNILMAYIFQKMCPMASRTSTYLNKMQGRSYNKPHVERHLVFHYHITQK